MILSPLLAPESDRIARLTVSADEGCLRLVVDAQAQTYRLGTADAGRFQLTQPMSPDDRWFIDASVPSVPVAAPVASPPFEHPWLDACPVVRGRRLLAELPRGEYLLVRAQAALRKEATVLLGNELVPNDGRFLSFDVGPAWKALVAGTNGPPDLTQTLIGIGILEYAGHANFDGVVFFPLEEEAPPTPVDEALVVIPLEGHLVLHAMSFFYDAKRQERARGPWAREGALALARKLAGES